VTRYSCGLRVKLPNYQKPAVFLAFMAKASGYSPDKKPMKNRILIDEKVNRMLVARLPGVVTTGSVMYAVFAVLHGLMLKGDIKFIMIGIAAFSSLYLAYLRRYMGSKRFKPGQVQILAFLTHFIFAFNSAAQLHFTGEIHQSTNLMLCISSVGVFFNNLIAGSCAILVSTLMWALLGSEFLADPLFPHFVIGIVVSAVVGEVFLIAQAAQARALAVSQIENEQREKTALALGNASTDALIIYSQGKIIAVNRKMTDLLGQSESEIMERDMSSIFHEDVRLSAVEAVNSNANGRLDVDLLGQHQNRVPVVLTYERMMVNQESVVTLSARSAGEELSKSLTAVDASLRTMAGGVAHEINNPLTIAKGYLSILSRITSAESFDRAQIQATVESIHSSVDRVASVVSALLTFATTSDTNSRPVIVFEVVRVALNFHRERFNNAGIPLDVSIDDEEQLILSRGRDVSQILITLLANSFDAVKNYSCRSVKLKVESHPDRVVFRVTDSGPPISTAIVSNLFHPFFTTKDPGDKTGLSLSMARKIATEHGGTLEYVPKTPETTFELTIPAWKGRVRNSA
jgi:signal transduction histidine kinase